MAIVQVRPEVLSDRLFGWSANPVKINSIQFDGDQWGNILIDVEGPDVPDCKLAIPCVTRHSNRLGECACTGIFSPADDEAGESKK